MDTVEKKEVCFKVKDASNVTMDVESSKPSCVATTTLSIHGTRDVQKVVKEIRDEHKTAYDYRKEV
ncbi:unnamed protein product, partial [Dovyalis caffra]